MKCPWSVVRLGEVLTLVERPEVPLVGTTYRQLGVRLWGEGAYERESIDGAATKYATLSRVEENDIVVNKIWARNGSVAVVQAVLDGCFVSGEFPTFVAHPNSLLPRWVHWLTKTPTFWAQCDEKSQGTSGKNRIKPEQFLRVEIPLPSLQEQQRIVARIEELAIKIVEARLLRKQTVEETKALVKAYRNTVFTNVSRSMRATRLDSVAACRLGKMLNPTAKTGVSSAPYLRNANVQWDYLDLREVFEMDFSEDEREEFSLQSGDILACEGGDIGKAAIWNNEIPGCCFQKALHRVRCDRQRIMPRFLLQHLFWAADQGHWSDLKTQTTIAHLTGVKLKAYGVYL